MNNRAITLAVRAALFGSAAMTFQLIGAEQQDVEQVATTDAQTKEVKEKIDEEHPNKITVTGSRIKRDSFSTSAPIATLGLEDIQDSGSTSLQDILTENFPAIGESSSNTNTQSSITHTGLSTVQLRNLGSDRTLILIDGRRVVSNSKNGNIVSTSTISSGMVQRIETLTGGASGVYGSDAVSGVVNFITQTGKEGFEAKVKGGYRPEGGGERQHLAINYGKFFNEGKGYTFFSVDTDRKFGVSFDEHDRGQLEASHSYSYSQMCSRMRTINGLQCMRDITQADWASKSDGIAGGLFEENKSTPGYWFDENNILRDDWNEERDGVNSRQWVWISTPIDRTNVAFKVDYDFGDNLEFYSQVQYNENESINTKSPEDDYESNYANLFDPVTGLPAGRVRAGFISTSNPFAPAIIADNAGSSISWDRRFYEVGQVTTDNQRSTLRTWAGLTGLAFNDEWEWDVSVGFGRFNQDLTRLNEIDVRKQAQALDSERLADGTIQCSDADARAAGCVPLNIFGVGSVTAEMADWIRVNPTINIENEMINGLAYISGDLFDMPAGSVGASFGVEYRRTSSVVEASDGAKNGGISYNIVPDLDGVDSVKEIFGELAVPLLRDVPGFQKLDLDLSLRIADYKSSNIDLVKSYHAGLNWEIIDGYNFRINGARAQRAPNIRELHGTPSGDFDSFDDICDGVTMTNVGPGYDACRQDPGVAAAIADGSAFDDDNNGYSPNAGNPELLEETADTLTVGFVLRPFDDLEIAIDYYDIEIDGAIGPLDNEEILRGCYDSAAPFGPDNSFCQDITRGEDGQLIEIVQRDQNLDSLQSRGVDVAMLYNYDLGDMGNLRFKLDYSHASEVSTTFDTPDGKKTTHDDGFGIPKDQAAARITYKLDNLRITWKTQWLGKFTNGQDYEADFLERVAENDATCAAGGADCITNPETPINLYFPSYVRHDLSVSYSIELENDRTLRIYGGMNNLFDNQGKFAPGSRGHSRGLYGSGTNQYVYAGATYNF